MSLLQKSCSNYNWARRYSSDYYLTEVGRLATPRLPQTTQEHVWLYIFLLPPFYFFIIFHSVWDVWLRYGNNIGTRRYTFAWSVNGSRTVGWCYFWYLLLGHLQVSQLLLRIYIFYGKHLETICPVEPENHKVGLYIIWPERDLFPPLLIYWVCGAPVLIEIIQKAGSRHKYSSGGGTILVSFIITAILYHLHYITMVSTLQRK